MREPLEAGKGEEADSHLEPPEGTHLLETLILAQGDPCRTFRPQTCKTTNVCCFKPLNLL